jgi:hypothetical protein
MTPRLSDNKWSSQKCVECEWPLHVMLAGCPYGLEHKLASGIDCKAFVNVVL